MFETDVRTDMFWCEEARDGDGTQLGAIIRDQDRLNQTFRHGTRQTHRIIEQGRDRANYTNVLYKSNHSFVKKFKYFLDVFILVYFSGWRG